MRNPLEIKLLGVSMKNPVIAASGTFGFGREYAGLMDVSCLGGISGKGLTLHGSTGNKGIRVYETPAGMLNSIGLENPGVKRFVTEEAPFMRTLGCAVLANLGGHSQSEYEEGAELLNEADIDILELNISCPNVDKGGIAFGMEPKLAAHITRLVKAKTRHPLLVKLSPNAPDICAVAKAVEDAGADGLCLMNTFLGMAVDIKNKKPVFERVYAGLSGPAIYPLALRMAHQICKAVRIPVVGGGGVATAEDAIGLIMVGATAVEVGAVTFANPRAMLAIIDGLEAYCEETGISNILDIKGILQGGYYG